MSMATVKRPATAKTAARTPDEAARRLRAAGFRVIEPKRTEPIRPIDVPGLDLSEALEEARGKRTR